tara:strand:+ start:5663 stop:6163 length:501 start_codon:yes stop_codon:yes gene_type:complete
MQDLLTDIFKKHSIWLDIVKSFGCNKDTAEDIVSEMYIKIKKNLDKGLDIHYGDDDYNYFYIFKTLKSLFLDLKRKEKKVCIISIDEPIVINEFHKHFDVYDNENYDSKYEIIKHELSKLYWYDKKVYELIDSGTSIATLSRKTSIPYHSLYNTYRKVIERLKKAL